MVGYKVKTKAQSKTKSRIGLDIGSYAVKMIEVSGLPEKPALVKLGSKKISGFSREEVTACVQSLAGDMGVLARDVGISVSGPLVIARFLTLPKMSDDDLAGAIKFEAEKFIPFNINDCVVDFQILKRNVPAGPARSEKDAARTGEEGDGRLNILLVAAKREHVEDSISLVEKSGLLVSTVDVSGLALTNSFSRNFSEGLPDKTVALLDIGASSTNVSIVTGGSISFIRQSAMGGASFTDAILKNMNIVETAAEELKVSGGGKNDEIAACTKFVMNNLLDDIKLSFSYHENQSGRNIDEVYMSGGGALIQGIDDAFEDAFGTKPKRWNPFGFLDTVSANVDAGFLNNSKDFFAVAVGLALR